MEENLVKGVLDGVYLLRASSGDVYRLVVYGGSVVSSGGGCEEGVYRIFRLSKVAGERKRYVELRIIPEDTLLHYYLVYPYWPEDTLEDKELLIELIPRNTDIYNPWTNQTETVKINRAELLQINTFGHAGDSSYIIDIDAPCPERPINKIYTQGFPDPAAIIDTLQALANWMNTQIDSSGLRAHIWPRLVPDPRIIPVKDTTGITTIGDVPFQAVAIIYTTGGGASTTDNWNDISNLAHGERWLARGKSVADIDYVVNEILKSYFSTHDVTLYLFSINELSGTNKRTSPKDIAYLVIYDNAANLKWEELAGNMPIEVYAYPEGIPIEDTLKLKHHLETYHGY